MTIANTAAAYLNNFIVAFLEKIFKTLSPITSFLALDSVVIGTPLARQKNNIFRVGKQSGFNGGIPAGKNYPSPVDSLYHFTSLESPLSFGRGGAILLSEKRNQTTKNNTQMETKEWFALALVLGTLPFVGIFRCMATSDITLGEEELCLIDFQKVPRMSIDDLKSHLNDASVVIMDVRAAGDWNGSSIKIKGTIREVYSDTEQWVSKYDKDKTFVLYCA